MKPTEAAQTEAVERARFRAFAAVAEAVLINAGWTQATRNGEPEPMVSRHGDVIKLRGLDKWGTPHSAAFDDDFSVHEYLASIEEDHRKKQQPELLPESEAQPSHVAPQTFADQLTSRIKDLESELSFLRSRPPEIREVERVVERVVEVPAPVVEEPEPPSDGVPESFRGLMLEDEPVERFTQRMKSRMQWLKHFQIDGTKPTNSRALPDMTEEEITELADLEARNIKSGNWLG